MPLPDWPEFPWEVGHNFELKTRTKVRGMLLSKTSECAGASSSIQAILS